MSFSCRKSQNHNSTSPPTTVLLHTLLYPTKLIIPLFSTCTSATVLPLDDKATNATSAFAGFYSPHFDFFVNIRKYMTRKSRASFLITLLAIFVFAACSLHLSRNALSNNSPIFRWNPPEFRRLMVFPNGNINHLVSDSDIDQVGQLSRHVSSVISSKLDDSVAVLMPDWEILAIVSPEASISTLGYGKEYVCLFQNNATSPARFSGVLPSTNRATFRCEVPKSVKRIRPFFQPILIGKTLEKEPLSQYPTHAEELYRWSLLAYDSYSTHDDVVLFVKGINNRQGINKPPHDFRCVFDDGTHGTVKTTVTSSVQEVFRCEHPADITGFGFLRAGKRIKISLELVNENLVVPSVAYYTITSRQGGVLAKQEQKSLVCACTMVYNVAKFLREWVMYHAKIGVDKFILYDNNSDDNLASVVMELIDQGYDVRTVFWIWPKTQEAGFSHSALYAKDMCTWMMYLDVDEFVFSPTWKDINQPSKTLLPSLLPAAREKPDDQPSSERAIGQFSFKCYDFGPSGQMAHPAEGVIQGYTCRRRLEQRHKSIVMLEAVDRSLSNVIHHFEVDQERFMAKQVSKDVAVVNHYKYQAWPEFRTKFRRRVSAYVADWTTAVNPTSKDRTPGLGFEAVEPKGWPDKFCDVRDDRLKLLTANWPGKDEVL